ncbi:hypothetical protein HZF24_03340 [Sedimentibacter hydroxybenzoicus DSM 7310]|uniref:Uncharacterized protein n=1 Tax=Sedimentibacter hydroxybenzoicus DSM 7310 TaxID=1123245 RepID=A0A974BHT2_SEDHY|nr:hypothetical protein [Sedimentibacter hydroxybenzoicus]NYB73171.1 hypothetical protein [Sedimentibacter hydroxybenzoicus DSM 7310]
MGNKDLRTVYIEQLNYLLPTVDFPKLDKSCNSEDDSYAKEILKRIHDIFTDIYGTDCLDSGYEFVELPAVIQGRNTGHIGLGIVTLDLESSGEHWGTFFLTPKGVIEQGGENIKPDQSKYLSTVYIPYEYWYTVSVERDHHVDFDNAPEKVAALLNHCYSEQPEMERDRQQEGDSNSNQQNGPVIG